MSPEKFEQLEQRQQMTLLLAMHIRNELEDFHVEQVADGDMPELNTTIRYAIHDFFETVSKDDQVLSWLALMIPDYWEVPGTDPRPTFTGEYLWQGKPIQTSQEEEES